MNYYQHHIGDFNNATRHLSLVERAIYRDLLDMYYDTEQPPTSYWGFQQCDSPFELG